MKKIVLLLVLLLFALTLSTQSLEEDRLIQKQIEIAIHSNQKAVFYSSRLRESDAMTYEVARERVEAIHYASEKFNYLYPEISPRRVAKDLFAIIDLETRFVNYSFESGVLDRGRSGGFISMLESTAREIAQKNNWSYERTSFIGDPKTQLSYMAFLYYENLRFFNDRMKAILAYNRGINGTNPNEIRWEEYYFKVLGRIIYFDRLYQEGI